MALSKPAPDGNELKITMWIFRECKKGLMCTHALKHGYFGKHIEAESLEEPLSETSSKPSLNQHRFAISYAHGEQDIRKRYIGHSQTVKGEKPTTLRLKLGAEWNVTHVIEKLVKISQGDRAGWIDRLDPTIGSNKPKSEAKSWSEKSTEAAEKRATTKMLQHIPRIFKSFPVNVLLPGRPCTCLDRLRDDAHQVGEFFECLNTLIIVSWFTRLWTRQELNYAHQITLHWTSPEPAKCIRVTDSSGFRSKQIRMLAATSRREFEKFFWAYARICGSKLSDISPLLLNSPIEALHTIWVSRKRAYYRFISALDPKAFKDLNVLAALSMIEAPRVSALNFLQNRLDNHFFCLNLSLREYLGRDVAPSEIARFLTGNTQVRHEDQGTIEAFAENLGRLSQSRRVASYGKDYVKAVWVDCPGYTLPSPDDEDSGQKHVDKESLSFLLDNATNQILGGRQKAMLTTAPFGLFGDPNTLEPSWKWKPSLVLPLVETDRNVVSSSDVYGPVTAPFRFVDAITGGPSGFSIPLKISKSGAQVEGLSVRARNFHETHFQSQAADVLPLLQRIVARWPKATKARLKDPAIKNREKLLHQSARFQKLVKCMALLPYDSPVPAATATLGVLMADRFVQQSSYRALLIRLFCRDEEEAVKAIAFMERGWEGLQNFEKKLTEFEERLNIPSDWRKKWVMKLIRKVVRGEQERAEKKDMMVKELKEQESYFSSIIGRSSEKSTWNFKVHNKLAWNLAADALGLNVEALGLSIKDEDFGPAKRDLVLVFTEDPPALGLMRRDFLAGSEEKRTVSLGNGGKDFGTVYYEAAAHGEQSDQTGMWRVGGVWVAQKSLPDEFCFATAVTADDQLARAEQRPDAFLV